MAYTIDLSNGTSLITGGLSDGTVDTSHTSLVLIGKNYAGYGQFLNDNFVRLLENFANSTSPANPLAGQLWWDTTNAVMRVYTGNSWKISTGATSSPASSPPGDLSALGGDLWFDSTNNQLKLYTGSQWLVVGPVATTATGDSGAFPALITDSGGAVRTIVQLKIKGIVYAIFAYENFNTSTPGFATIRAGLNFNTNNTPAMGLSTQDTAATASTLVQRDSSGGITAASVASGTINTTGLITSGGGFSGSLSGNVAGQLVNSTQVLATTVSTASTVTAAGGFVGTINTAAQPNITTLGNVFNLSTNGQTSLTGYATYNGAEIATTGANASITFGYLDSTIIGSITPRLGKFTDLIVSNVAYPFATGVINLGQPGAVWNGVYANAAITSRIINSGNASIGGILTVTGNANMLANLSITSQVNATTVMASVANISTSVYTPSLTIVNGTVSGNINPSANLVSNLGSVTNWYNNIYGTAIHALYADVAERFHSDAPYSPGTVVELGGPVEITKVKDELSDKVFGVISTNAAYLMNSGAGSNETHPPVAMSGRVPVRVIGLIAKGERLVSAGNGLARAGKSTELTPWNVIGRSLVDKTDTGESTIEAIVKINS
jgi:hypothetical protein